MVGRWVSERDRSGEQASRPVPRPDTARQNSTASMAMTGRAGAAAPFTAGRAGEPQRVRLAVPGGPLGDHVGDEHAVVVGQ
mgnify:CR=1 FL=1